MRSVSAFLRVLAVTLSVMVAAAAVGAPPPITNLAQKVDLTPQDRQSIREYSAHYGGIIQNGHSQPESVLEARQKLLEPLRVPRVRETFLDAYSRELSDVLEPAINGTSPHAASNALIILSQLGTESSLEKLTSRCSMRDEPRWTIRLRAAGGCGDLLQSRQLMVNPRAITGAARRLRDAALQEPHPLVLRRQLEGIFAGDRPSLDPGTRRQLFEYVSAAMKAAAERAADPQLDAQSAVEIMDAVHSVLARIKIALTSIVDPSLQRPLVRELVDPTLQLLHVPLAHWAPLHEDEALEAEVRQMVEQGERMLETIALFSGTRAPNGINLQQSWSTGNREQYEQELQTWKQQLSGG